MVKQQNGIKSYAWLLAVILLATQVAFPLLHDHHSDIRYNDEVSLIEDGSTTHDAQSACEVCEQLFAQSAVLTSDPGTSIFFTAQSVETVEHSPLLSRTVHYAPSRAPPALA